MTIAIFGNTYRPNLLSIVEFLFLHFTQKEIQLKLDKELYDYFRAGSTYCPEDLVCIETDDFTADLALSIGGDGTFLTTAARIGSKNIPILGINTGRLGFLADIAGDQLESAIDAILQNELQVEERSLLKVDCSGDIHLPYAFALNDVAILKQDSSSMLSINTYLNGEAVHTYHADGLIIATPTGSTAYSMSVGGPILTPDAHNFVLSPIASHSLTVRPMVIPDDWLVEVDVFTRSGNFQVSLDGRTVVLEQGTRLSIRKADYTIKVARQLNHTFFDTLKSKLMWGMDKRN